MQISRRLAQTALSCAACVFLDSAALAIDLTGAWATDAGACGKVFATKGKKTAFRADSDMFGSGFIMDGPRIRGRMATCTVTKTKEDGSVLHMLASCATDIMYSNVQFSVKVEDDNKITRIFPGIEGMELTYYRCPSR
jgi:hypothetical protein